MVSGIDTEPFRIVELKANALSSEVRPVAIIQSWAANNASRSNVLGLDGVECIIDSTVFVLAGQASQVTTAEFTKLPSHSTT